MSNSTSPTIEDVPPVTEAEEALTIGTWLTVFGGVLGAFIAVLNIHITNASLKDIQGALSATLEEGSFISTAYLTAEVVVIPITGWLAMVFGLRPYMLFNTVIFAFTTLLCASAWNLESMLVFRTLAGLAGGTLIPLSFMLILTLLPPSKQAIGMGMFALTATQAPSIGPTLGGYLTEVFGWQSVFYLQIVPTGIMFLILFQGLKKTKPQLNLLKNGDWFGILSMSVGLGAMIIVLEEGNRKDWLESDFIFNGALLAATCLITFVAIELKRKNPFINLRLLKRRNFLLSNLVGIILGLGLYGSVFIMPMFLAQVHGFNAMQIGLVMMWVGLPQLIVVPIVLRLMPHIDIRILLAFGAFIFGFSCLLNIHMSADYGHDHLVWPNIVRGLGMPFIMVPLNVIATAGIEKEQVGSASGLFNVLRNLGGAVGIATLATFLSLRQQFHSNHIVENISAYNPFTMERLQGFANYFGGLGADPILAQEQALLAVDAIARRESFIMAYNDCFYFMGAAFIVSLGFIALMKKPG
ncbi:MAG: DHA2 family efflux MFS transporter permease subunit [Candidatus Reddybacter sp.]